MYSKLTRLVFGQLLILGAAFLLIVGTGTLAYAEGPERGQGVQAEAPIVQIQASTNPLQLPSQGALQDEAFLHGDVFYQGGASTAGTILNWAFYGGLVGAVVGLGGYFLSGFDWSPWTIAQFAGGGVVVGAAIGAISALTRDDQPVASSVEWIERQAPKTFTLPVLNLDF